MKQPVKIWTSSGEAVDISHRSPERRVLSSLSANTQHIPVSPTANLKLLTSVASELEAPASRKRCSSRTVITKESEVKPRKDKSLGILCDKFLTIFPLTLPPGCAMLEICLDRVAQQLGIVKRRIYDIINILESLQMASKIAKNRYHWHGSRNLASTLGQLKAMALKYGVDAKLKEVQTQQRNGFRLVTGPTCCRKSNSSVVSSSQDQDYSKSGTEEVGNPNEDFFSDERTLGIMCQKFIMLFLATPQCSGMVNLDLATRMLVSEAAEGNAERHLWGKTLQCHRKEGEEMCRVGTKECRCQLRLKTKVRRLYDIANVLTSLGLISKMENPSSSMRKPVFIYTGPVVVANSAAISVPSVNCRQSLLSTLEDDDEGIENRAKTVTRKRKDSNLRRGPANKLPRMSSENTLTGQFENAASSCQSARHIVEDSVSGNNFRFKSSLDDILQVAEQELEKLRREQLKTPVNPQPSEQSGARKKLTFSRSHSDTCILPQLIPRPELLSPKAQENTCVIGDEANNHQPQVPLQKNICISISDSKTKSFTITRKLVEIPSHVIPKKLNDNGPFKVSSITKLQAQTLNTLFGKSNKTETPEGSLSPTSADVLNNNKSPSVSVAISDTQGHVNCKPSFGVLKPVTVSAASSIAHGELYRAIKIGSMVRLVPLLTSAKAGDLKK